MYSLYGVIIESLFLVSEFDTFKGFGLRKFLFHMNKNLELVLQGESEVDDVHICFY